MPTIYKTDSARFDKNGVAVLQSKAKTLGGIYIILLSDKKTFFEFLLNNGDDMSITATAQQLPDGIVFKGSSENDHFLEYVKFLKGFGAEQQSLQAEMGKAKTSDDTAAIRKKMQTKGKALVSFRRDYVKRYPGTLLSSIFNALEMPEIPEGTHYTSDGKVDSNFAYTYYKAHYWDGFDLSDDRLIHTPIFDAKLEEYFNKLVIPTPDSMEKEADWILGRTGKRDSSELFKYALWWTTRNAETSKVMGMDEVFVYLVEDYILRGKAFWMDNETVEKYREAARKISPNVLGHVAPEIVMEEYGTHKQVALSSVKAKYTIVVFWDPTCGHCTKEIPALDSVYRAVLKAKGTKVYSIRTEGPEDKWQEFIKKNGLTDWINVYDPEHHSDYRSKYNVYSTPVIYLLDENKIIQGKRLDHSNIAGLIEMLEKKEKANSKKSKS